MTDYRAFAQSLAFVLDKYAVTSSATATADSQYLANIIAESVAKSVAENDANIITQTIDILNDKYYLIKKKSKPFIFNQASEGLYYNWSSSYSNNYVAYTYSPGTTFLVNKISDPTLKLQQSQVLIFAKADINDKTQVNPSRITTLVLPSYIQGIRSSLIIEDDQNNPFILLGTFSYPKKETANNSLLLKWYFKSNKLETILIIKNDNSIRKIIRYQTHANDDVFLSTQNDVDNAILSKIYKLPTKDIIKYNTVEQLTPFLKTYTLTCNNQPIYGAVWDFEIDLDENIFISIPQKSVDNEKISGFTTKGRLYYNKLSLFKQENVVNLLSLIGNDYYPPGFDEDAISTFQTQSNGTSRLIIYSLSDFLYQFLAILTKLNSTENGLFQNSSLSDIEPTILKIRELFKNVDINGFKVFYLDKNELYNSEVNPSIYCLIGEPPINTINKSTSGNGHNNLYNVYAWQSTCDIINDKVYIGSLDISDSIYNFLIGIIENTYPLLYMILKNLPENIKILILDILIEKPSLPIDFRDKQFYFDVLEIDPSNKVDTITTNGFKTSQPKLSDEGVRTLMVIKNENGKFLSVGSTCYQLNNVAKIYTLSID